MIATTTRVASGAEATSRLRGMGASLPKTIDCTIAIKCCYWQSPVEAGEDVGDCPCDDIAVEVEDSNPVELEGGKRHHE